MQQKSVKGSIAYFYIAKLKGLIFISGQFFISALVLEKNGHGIGVHAFGNFCIRIFKMIY